MAPFNPLHELVFFFAIPLLHFTDKPVIVPLNLLQVIVGKLTPIPLQFTCEPRPIFEFISVHGIFLLCERSMSQSMSHCTTHRFLLPRDCAPVPSPSSVDLRCTTG